MLSESSTSETLIRFVSADAPALKENLKSHVPMLVEALIQILLSPTTPKSLLENAAVTIGRLGLVFPELVSIHLGSFGKTW